MFLIELPPDFDPAEWGWTLAEPARDDARGRMGDIWLRWETPWRFPATLGFCTPASRVAWYGHSRFDAGDEALGVEPNALLLEICCGFHADLIPTTRDVLP